MDSIRKIIREILLKEMKEHSDDEIINFKEIDLQHEFNKINALLFNGELKPVLMKWNLSRNAHGIVNAYINRIGGRKDIVINFLAMSQFLEVPYKNFKDTLAHEMIHVKLLQKNINDGHGYYFQGEMHRINNLGLGFNITITTDLYDFNINKDIKLKEKELVVAIINNNINKDCIAVMTPKTYESQYNTLETLFTKLVNRAKYKFIDIVYLKITSSELIKFPVQRSFERNVSYTPVSKEFIDKLKSIGKIIKEFKFP